MNRPTTLYEQLADNIKNKIVNGELKVGDRLMPEREMSTQYGINRMTVRKSLKLLEDEGVIKAYRGKGTYVLKVPSIQDKVELGGTDLISLSMQIRQKGLKSSREILSFKKIKSTKEFEDYFPDSEQLYELIRLSLVNDEPYAIQKTYIPCNLFHDAERFDFIDESLYDYMEEQGHSPHKMVSYLKIEKIPKEYVDVLKLSKQKNVFLFDYFGFDENHKLVEYTISYHLPEYTSFKYITRRID
ncbi:GntR family transcriptional regulator [Breznakia sp. PF5-3]|uniref:GntR family transcriptional regulator n=1 Tax=unclassified Breznakia TaxID=2623764 RepID=UPI0024067D80|nr:MULTISPECIES: GntR family transcriptional regulator [unclassified Breznakia]MDL2276487.1 GntR family transcriptional regulator [Breznakia sp. OttesenSCG-928-G09]MDF9824247.1 GntR family transcriptional regulator [Breznakia sp. PM6-1]MDF9835186.1 GntR family transcriptional regulator [Breznakia sp. PF5-3]MDF9837298.1 GntR family transcriptional regulator [Breznakia sp. PFB2-8]MDF9859433.1 GntR family transcriptional regulator [Breznakia sp. PH5-24]